MRRTGSPCGVTPGRRFHRGDDEILISRRYPSAEAGLAYLDLNLPGADGSWNQLRAQTGLGAPEIERALSEARAERAQSLTRAAAQFAKHVHRLITGAWRPTMSVEAK